MPKPLTRTAAIVTIRQAPQMTTRGRRAIVRWLIAQANHLKQHAKLLGPRYTARYRY